MPEIVATCFVSRLVNAIDNRMSAMVNSPIGISILPMRIFPGTFHSRSSGRLKRNTTVAIALNEKLQITPNA